MSELYNPTTNSPIRDVLESELDTRIHGHGISEELCPADLAEEQMHNWKFQGSYTVFNAGGFDLLTLNHVLSLTHCRMIGAMSLIGMDKIASVQDQQVVHEIAASNTIRLMITMDTNTAIEEGKSRQESKGGAPKPVLDWQSRATILAMQSIPTTESGLRRNAVDFITRHGTDCCATCMPGTCTNEDNALMAARFQPNLVVINAASTRTVEDIQRYKEEGSLPYTDIAIVDEEDEQYFDPILNGPVKTTNIIHRIRS